MSERERKRGLRSGSKRPHFHSENTKEKNSASEKSNIKRICNNSDKKDLQIRKRKQGLGQIKTESTWYCSWTLFPHLMYLYNLTCDFVKRYRTYLGDCKPLNCLRNPLEDFNVQIDIKEDGRLLEKECCKNGFEENVWPEVLKCVVKDEASFQITDEAIQMNTKARQILQDAINENRKPLFEIQKFFSNPVMKNIHEAMTEILERPIHGFLNKVRSAVLKLGSQSLQNELDMLLKLKIVKPTAPSVKSCIESYPSNDNKNRIPENIKDYLCRKREVVGFGLWWNGDFIVLVNKKEKSRHLETNLLLIGDKFFQHWSLKVHESNLKFELFLQQGDKIYPSSADASLCTPVVGPSSQGTVGGFVKDSGSNIYALTCSHVCNLDNKQAFAHLSKNSPIEKIGECVFSGNLARSGECCDISLVQIDGHLEKHCKLSMGNRFRENCYVTVEELSKIDKDDFVHKKGATTSFTTGKILSREFHCNIINGESKMFLVSGMSGKFSERGDSGSIVYVNEQNSLLDTIRVIGIVSGGEIEQRDSNPQVDFENTTFCYELYNGLEIARTNNFDVSFENQKQSS
ncbi:uncharacterized protein LOC134273281 [Saccostrea cucullata]|uniref:uncharacterized protein LOC134273281 n=1 Tax=Saccostrea cuccullata TaxID=36930 RepID=UPI002ED5B74D